MTKEIGLWIDHRMAVIVTNLGPEEEIQGITAKIEKRVHNAGSSFMNDVHKGHQDTSEDGRDRRFANTLNRYYDDVIAYLRDVTSILILGPGEAKIELQKRLERHGLSDRVDAIKAADKMTEDQIAAEVRQHFREAQHGSNRATQQQ